MPRDGVAAGMTRSIAARQTQVASSCQAWTDGPATSGQRNGNATSPARTAPTALDGRAAASAGAAREVIPPIVPTGRADEWRRMGDERFCGKTHLETFLDNCLQLLPALWRKASKWPKRYLLDETAIRPAPCFPRANGFDGLHVDRGHGHSRHRRDPRVDCLSELHRLFATRKCPGGSRKPVRLPRPDGAVLPRQPQLRYRYHLRDHVTVDHEKFHLQLCARHSPQTYTATATGRTGTSVAGFAYTIDQRNSQGTTCTNCAWGFSNSTSWILRKP